MEILPAGITRRAARRHCDCSLNTSQEADSCARGRGSASTRLVSIARFRSSGPVPRDERMNERRKHDVRRHIAITGIISCARLCPSQTPFVLQVLEVGYLDPTEG